MQRRHAVGLRRLKADRIHAKAEIGDRITRRWESVRVFPYEFQSLRRINGAFGAWTLGFLGYAAYGQSQEPYDILEHVPQNFLTFERDLDNTIYEHHS